MAQKRLLIQEPTILPALEPGFRPVSLGDMAYLQAAKDSGVEVRIAYEREDCLVARGDTYVLPEGHPNAGENLEFILDKVTAGVIHNGAHRVWFSGPGDLGKALQLEFSSSGSRKWVAVDLAGTSYDVDFIVRLIAPDGVPHQNEMSAALGGGLVGNRIGFDLGASDFKVAAFRGTECVFAHEFEWDPKPQKDPRYHFAALLYGLTQAAKSLDYKVDGIGGSSAGVWVDNRLKIGSIARGVKATAGDLRGFNQQLVDGIADYFKIRPVIINDGNVTARAGQLFIPGAGGVAGIAMGSDEAGGYAHPGGKMDTKLYEWAFWRVDRGSSAPVEEWSKLQGIGGMYFGQRAYARLYTVAGISHEEIGGQDLAVDKKLLKLQALVDQGDERAMQIPATIGVELGYSVMPYIEDSGPTSHVIIVGRCMRGKSGEIILANADRVLRAEFGSRYNFELFNPESDSFKDRVGAETARKFVTLGQSMAAATLPPVYK